MSLLDEALVAPSGRGPQCTVGRARNTFPELADEIDELVEAVAAGKIHGTTAARIASAHGLGFKDEAIRRHARRNKPGEDGCECR